MTDSKIITRLFFRLLPVQIIIVAIGSINSIIDGIIASNMIGPIALSIIGLYMPMIKLTDTVNAVMGGGSQILCGQFLGKGEIKNTNKVFSLDLIFTVVFSLILSAIMLITPGPVGTALGANAETIDGITDYLRAMSFGVSGSMLASQFTVFMQLEQQEKRTYIGVGAMAVANVTFNILFVNVLQMGIFGLGLSTSISSWIFCLIQVSYYFTDKAVIRFSLKNLDFTYLKDMIRIGIPGAVEQICLTIRGFALNSMIVWFAGNNALSAFSAVGTLGSVYYATTAGVASATRLLVSVYYGEEDRAGLLMIMKTALFKGVALVGAVAALCMALSVPFTGMFCNDPSSEVYQLTFQYFFIFPLSMPFSAFCVIFNNYYQCTDRIKMVDVISVMDGAVGVLISALMLAPFMGAMGIWLAQVLNGVYTTISVFVYTMIVNKRFPTSVEEMLIIPEGFGVPENDRLDICIKSREEVINTSEAVTDFCKAHGISRKYSNYSGLCIEEMAGNIVKFGFKDGKAGTIDIRVVYKNGGILIRFKDTCKPFDPKEYLKLFTPDDVTHNIGIRMISRICTGMEYNYVLGLNVLTIIVREGAAA